MYSFPSLNSYWLTDYGNLILSTRKMRIFSPLFRFSPLPPQKKPLLEDGGTCSFVCSTVTSPVLALTVFKLIKLIFTEHLLYASLESFFFLIFNGRTTLRCHLHNQTQLIHIPPLHQPHLPSPQHPPLIPRIYMTWTVQKHSLMTFWSQKLKFPFS